MSTVTRVVVTADHRVALETTDRPEPGPGEVRVRTLLAGVCGSDTHALHGRHPFIPLPYAPGHEVVGVVDAVGEGVVDAVGEVAVGDRVTVEPTLPCWRCKQCRAGRENLCESLGFFGCGGPQGGMAEEFTVPASRLHQVPDDLDDARAALVEPLATPVHAARLAGPLRGRAVAVLGAGTIGMLVLAVVRAAGASRVVVTDVLEAKRDRALAAGADAVVDASAPDTAEQVRTALGESADVVVDCVAVQATVGQAVAMALNGGTVVVVGVPASEVTVPLPLVQDQQVRIQGSATYLSEDYADAFALLRSGAVDPARVVTAEYPLERAGDAFAASASGSASRSSSGPARPPPG